jgi:release factor glutamine methyltransferase
MRCWNTTGKNCSKVWISSENRMTTTEVWTIGRLLQWTTDFLKKSGSASARLDAEILLAHAKNCPRIQLYTSFNEEPTEAERATFREMVKRRAEGAPVAYLVGRKEFYSIDFIVNADCLIPRPETEHLVVAALDWVRNREKLKPTSAGPLTVVDVCTGSGCVAISLAKHLPNITMVASDLSHSALKVATANLEKHQLADRISMFEGDLLDALPANLQSIDLVVSNPPYISESELAGLAKDVRDFEPKIALVSEDAGLATSVRLLEQAESRLASDGAIMLESSPMVIPRLETWIQTRPGWSMKPTLKDLSGHRRIVIAERI